MKKNYISEIETLEVGADNLSQQLAWLLRSTIHFATGENNAAVNSVVYSKDLPKSDSDKIRDGVWGAFHAATRAIVINLEHHWNVVMENIQNEKLMNNSMRTLLLRDLLDTCAHEAWHARKCVESHNWRKDDLDEQGAKDNAWKLSWGMAEYWDVNLDNFGPLLDSFMQSLYKDLKEDVQEDDCKEWKKIQLHMLENEVNYYNPESGVEIRTIREVFQAQVGPEIPWMDTDNPLFNAFVSFTSIADRISKEEEVIGVVSSETNILTPAAVKSPAVATSPEHAPAVAISPEPTPAPAIKKQVVTEHVTTTVCADYDPLSDSACDMDNPFDDDIATPEMVTQPNITAPVMDNTTIPVEITPAQVAVAPAVDGSVTTQQPTVPQMDVLRIQKIAEQVLRRMFHHVNTKCEFNTDGGYNNINAILDPINITDIDGASELFTKQDTLDANGVFQSHTDVNGFIKGLPTAKGLPRYTFYMNMGGKLHKRVFIAQNPEKKKADGVTPTAFAAKAQAGYRIMMLLADGAGITADITLENGSVLGQEVFNIWNKK